MGDDVHRAGPRARAQPLGFGDAAGTNPSTDVVPVLNHEAGTSRFVRAYNVHGIEVPVRQAITLKWLLGKGNASSDRC